MDRPDPFFSRPRWLSSRIAWGLAFSVVAAIRIYLCAAPPEETSDLFRQLGFSRHFWDRGIEIYSISPTVYSPEFWTRFWPTSRYQYPPGALLFFAALARLGAGLSVAKLILTAFDFGTSLLISRLRSPIFGFLYFSMPAALWYVSHEGQYDGLAAFFVAAALATCERGRFRSSGALWSIALQIKQTSLFLAPYFIAQIFSKPREQRRGVICMFLTGLGAVALPLLPFYFAAPDLWLRPLEIQSFHYNPFYWNPWAAGMFDWNPSWLIEWNTIFTLAILAVIVLIMAAVPGLLRRIQGLPALVFWSALKTSGYSQFWYVLIAPALSLSLPRTRRLCLILMILYWFQCGRSLELLTGPYFGYRELPQTIEIFRSCLWTCDTRRTH